MRIKVNNEWLDMSESDISMHWQSMRFSDILANSFTNDFELPATARNIRLLDVWSVLSRVGEPFGSLTPCQVLTADGGFDGQLSVNGVKGEIISVTVYLTTLPAVLSENVRSLVVDDANTIVGFTHRPMEVIGDTDATNYTLYASTLAGVLRPNVKLSYLLTLLWQSTGVAMPTVSNDYRLVGTRQVVCPQVTRQAILRAWTGSEYALTYGQHITNTVDTDALSVLYNRACSATVDMYINTTYLIEGAAQVKVQRRHNGGAWSDYHITYPAAVGTITTTLTMTLDEGDEVRIDTSAWQGNVFADITYSDYDISGDDYDTPLLFDVNADYSLPSWMPSIRISFIYYGVLANLPDFTVRELLSSMAWMLGKRIDATPWAVTLSNATKAETVGAQITEINFVSAELGRIVRVESADGETLASAEIPNGQLEDSKTLHKSIFAKLQGVQAMNIAFIDLYSEDGGAYKPIDFKGVAIAVRTQNAYGTVYLTPASWSLLGVEQLTRVCEITAVTRDRVSGLDYVYIDGHKFMLVESDTDERSALTTFKALQI